MNVTNSECYVYLVNNGLEDTWMVTHITGTVYMDSFFVKRNTRVYCTCIGDCAVTFVPMN